MNQNINLKMKTFLMSVLLGIVLTNSWVAAQVPSATTNNNALEAIPVWSKSVVMIWFECGEAPFTGTGVIVSKSGAVITAAHVGRDCDNKETKINVGTVTSPYLPPKKLYSAKLIARENDRPVNPNVYDLALLKIDNPQNVVFFPATFSKTLPVPGDDISVVGFSQLPFDYLEQRDPTLSVFRTHIISVAAKQEDGVPFRLHYGGASLPGMSGGPVFDKNGFLIGIHSTRSTENISNLLTNKCSDADYARNNCFGNAKRFEYRDGNNQKQTQEININYNAVKKALDNYSWATSVSRIPKTWLE